MESHHDKRDDWAASPVPSAWLQCAAAGNHELLSVDPVTHARVRALPTASLDAAEENQLQVERDNDGNDDEEEEEEDLKQPLDGGSADLWTEMKAPAARAQQLVAPQPRRVVSPELIFSSAAESLCRHKRLRFSPSLALARAEQPISGDAAADAAAASNFDTSRLGLVLPRVTHFRPIVADRPDVALTSPPMRAANPVEHDSRFRNLPKLDLEPPLQPFYPRATRRHHFHHSSA